MEEKATPAVRVEGERWPHPALRRLAQACIGLARWRRDAAHVPVIPIRPDVQPDNSTEQAQPDD